MECNFWSLTNSEKLGQSDHVMIVLESQINGSFPYLLTCLSFLQDLHFLMVNKSCKRIQQQIPIPTASFSSSVDSWPALSLSVEMDKIVWVWQKRKIITKLGHVGSLGLHFPSFRFQHVSTVSSSQRGHWKLPVQRVTEATNSGVTTRWSLGVRWFDVGSSCNLCVVKMNKKTA